LSLKWRTAIIAASNPAATGRVRFAFHSVIPISASEPYRKQSSGEKSSSAQGFSLSIEAPEPGSGRDDRSGHTGRCLGSGRRALPLSCGDPVPPGAARSGGSNTTVCCGRASLPDFEPPSPAPAPPTEAAEPAVSQEILNELEIQQLRRDVSQLRTEQDFLRSELVAMRLDMNELQASRERMPAPPQQYVRPESPQHSEAMLLAGRGVAATQIAEHCGISVAEAELVCALARAEGGT